MINKTKPFISAGVSDYGLAPDSAVINYSLLNKEIKERCFQLDDAMAKVNCLCCSCCEMGTRGTAKMAKETDLSNLIIKSGTKNHRR